MSDDVLERMQRCQFPELTFCGDAVTVAEAILEIVRLREELATLEKYRNCCLPAINSVLSERRRQDARWGRRKHAGDRWITILAEEVGEAARAMLELGEGDFWRHELVQVAAVAIAAIEQCDGEFERASTGAAYDEAQP